MFTITRCLISSQLILKSMGWLLYFCSPLSLACSFSSFFFSLLASPLYSCLLSAVPGYLLVSPSSFFFSLLGLFYSPLSSGLLSTVPGYLLVSPSSPSPHRQTTAVHAVPQKTQRDSTSDYRNLYFQHSYKCKLFQKKQTLCSKNPTKRIHSLTHICVRCVVVV